MDLGRFVLDKQLLDSDKRRCGKVDDLALVAENDELPVVAGILAQQGTLARDMGGFIFRLVRWLYRLVGIRHPEPVFIAWDLVDKIDVVVHLCKTRHALGLDRLQSALGERIIGKIPGA